MNNQEYEQKEQKKLEYYRELMEQNQSGLLSIATFEFIFDRAYALGKQTETVTQEEIVEAAKKYDSEHAYYNSNDVIECFVEGANFALGKQEKAAEKKSALTDKEVYALESTISELESLIEGTLDEDYHKEQKSIINALKRIIKKYEKK